MELRPILTTLLRHKTAAALIVLEIALTCAIICNALFLIGTRLEKLRQPSGVAESELMRIQLAGVGIGTNTAVRTREDLAALHAVPGVRFAASTNQLPYGNSSWNSGVSLKPAQQTSTLNAATYMGSENLLETLGVRLVAGRDFLPDEYVDFTTLQAGGDDAPKVPAAILNRDTAQRLFPDGDALGKSIYVYGDTPIKVVGIVERLARPNSSGGGASSGYAMVMPIRTSFDIGGNYLVRGDAPRRAEILKAAVAALEKVDRSRIMLNQQTFDEIRADYFQRDRSMAWMLAVVCIALLLVTAFGIVGLASFWVQQRTKQIGIRRALGATRGQILRYFQIENFLLATIGIALGMLLAYAINQLLMGKYELPRLPLMYLPIGAAALWLLGQVAVFGPARRASAVPPAVATRSV